MPNTLIIILLNGKTSSHVHIHSIPFGKTMIDVNLGQRQQIIVEQTNNKPEKIRVNETRPKQNIEDVERKIRCGNKVKVK